FYWFNLAADTAPPVWSSATSGPAIEHHTFVLRHNLSEVVENGARTTLQNEVLPGYVRQRRWFQHKDKQVEHVEVALAGLIGADADCFLYTEIAVTSDGRQTRYALPMAIAWENAPSNPFESPLALARVRKGARVGLLTDAFASPALARTVIAGLRAEKRIPLGSGEILFCPTDYFLESQNADLDDPALEWPAAEQTNSTMVVGRKLVLKLLRRLGSGRHPEGEMSRFLTDKGFEGTPPLLGEMMRVDGNGDIATLVIAQGYVFNQGDGWEWTINRLSRIVDEGATPFTETGETGFAEYAEFARRTGLRIGQMHRLLAEPSEDPAFSPEVITASRAAAVGARILGQFDAALNAGRATRNSEIAAAIKDIAARRNELAARINDRAQLAAGLSRTRIHGDLHLGQVLVTSEDVQIIDFEGEPAKALDERRRKYLPLRDVAGMLRSFDYAAVEVERRTTQAGGGEGVARAAVILADFRRYATKALLQGYEDGLGQRLSEQQAGLLDLLMLEKAAYEVCYESANRPDWLAVPVGGLRLLVERLLVEDMALA
ncbi:MAG TPA: putative maltokinase, partial [Rhizomicrobium sp.]|nr:putative maltokinase [Rhizomicrobium sp.]